MGLGLVLLDTRGKAVQDHLSCEAAKEGLNRLTFRLVVLLCSLFQISTLILRIKLSVGVTWPSFLTGDAKI